MPRHSLSSTSSYRPNSEEPSTPVEPEVVALSGLARLPPELLLQIMLYLPVESAAAVALISKYHYAALKQYVLPGLSDTAGKKRFLRLLEADLAEYIACHCCDILYQWKACAPRYKCPRRYRRGMTGVHTFGRKYCPQHYPRDLPLETVAVFLRGYERGPAYGPQLQDLHHKCDGALPWHHWSPGVSRDTAARVVNGKLLLRTSYSLQVSLQQSLAPSSTSCFSLAVDILLVLFLVSLWTPSTTAALLPEHHGIPIISIAQHVQQICALPS